MPCRKCSKPQGRKAYGGLCAQCRREFKKSWRRFIIRKVEP
jgi:hypothetical protein